MRLSSLRCSVVLAVCALAMTLVACNTPQPDPEIMLYRTLEHDGLQREYFVHVPANANSESPLVLVLHGFTSTATGFATMHDLNRFAEDHGFIAVYPQGSHFTENDSGKPFRVTSWNFFADTKPAPDAGPMCTDEATQYTCPPSCGECDRCDWATCNDDLGFFDKLFAELESEFEYDRDRVYMFGESNGGMMMFRLACDRSEKFAAVASLIAQMPAGYACTPSTNLPLLVRYGGIDDLVRADGKPGGDDGFIYTSVAETTGRWAKKLSCTSGPAPWQSEYAETAGLECSSYGECAIPGQEVVSCENPGAWHQWTEQLYEGWDARCANAQQLALMPGQMACPPLPQDRSTRGMDVIWEFLSKYRRE